MFNELKERIKDKKLIVFGEIHGGKEIPEFLSKFFSEIAKEEDFNVCLEIPVEFQNVKLERILSLARETGTSGLINEEYIELIKTMPENVKVFFVAPNKVKNQEEAEKGLADNILRTVDKKKTFAILGNVHASKKVVSLLGMNITPAGFFIKQKLGNSVYSIRIAEKQEKIGDEDRKFNEGFDYVYEI